VHARSQLSLSHLLTLRRSLLSVRGHRAPHTSAPPRWCEVMHVGVPTPPPPPRPLTIVIGLAKSGTTSVHKYFECSGWSSSHWGCGAYSCAACVLDFVRKVGLVQMSHASNGAKNGSAGLPKCLSWQGWLPDLPGETFPAYRSPRCAVNYPDLQPLFRSSCGSFDVFSQIDAPQPYVCLQPQVAYLHTLIQTLPRACFILTVRPTSHWLRSLRSFRGMDQRLLASCPIYPRNAVGLAAYYEHHVSLAKHLLTSTARCGVVLEVEASGANETLADAFPGTRADCWGKHNRRDQRNPRGRGR